MANVVELSWSSARLGSAFALNKLEVVIFGPAIIREYGL
jgi:hypothetical protein